MFLAAFEGENLSFHLNAKQNPLPEAVRGGGTRLPVFARRAPRRRSSHCSRDSVCTSSHSSSSSLDVCHLARERFSRMDLKRTQKSSHQEEIIPTFTTKDPAKMNLSAFVFELKIKDSICPNGRACPVHLLHRGLFLQAFMPLTLL